MNATALRPGAHLNRDIYEKPISILVDRLGRIQAELTEVIEGLETSNGTDILEATGHNPDIWLRTLRWYRDEAITPLRGRLHRRLVEFREAPF